MDNGLSELSVNLDTKNSAPKNKMIPAIAINEDPKNKALVYSSLIRSYAFAPKFCPPIESTAVFNPITGNKKTCSTLRAAPYPAVAKSPNCPIKYNILKIPTPMNNILNITGTDCFVKGFKYLNFGIKHSKF